MMRTWKRIVIVGAAVVVTAVTGCGETYAPQSGDNRDVVTADGRFIGHLKPDIRAIGAFVDSDQPIHDPVVWVVEEGAVRRPEYELPVNLYRLDFDETRAISDEMLPYALMTEQTREVVIHRGPSPVDFSHSDINDGERCVPILRCTNPDCPYVNETQSTPMFPQITAGETVACPHCGTTSNSQYQTPQHYNMRRFMEWTR